MGNYTCPNCAEYLETRTDLDNNNLPFSWFVCVECGWDQRWKKN